MPAAVLLGVALLVGLGGSTVPSAAAADKDRGTRLCTSHGSYSPLTRDAVRTYRQHDRLRPTGVVCMSPQRALASRRSVQAERAARSEAREAREPQSASSEVASLNWKALAECESGGDPNAVNASGYYGLYQFDAQTWQALGGSGVASDASASEQTRRAQQLYLEQGDSPWPNCGELLHS